MAEEGKLFGSVSPVDIAELLRADIAVQRLEVSMPEGPIKTIGEHPVALILHPEVHASVLIVVEPENEVANSPETTGAVDGESGEDGAGASEAQEEPQIPRPTAIERGTAAPVLGGHRLPDRTVRSSLSLQLGLV